MNWDAIGAIAELLGAIGVIGSLVYLATQLKASTQASQLLPTIGPRVEASNTGVRR